METVNVAIVRSGYIGTRHAESLKRLTEQNVIAFVDQDLDRAAHLRQTAGTAAAVGQRPTHGPRFEDPNIADAVVESPPTTIPTSPWRSRRHGPGNTSSSRSRWR